MGDVLGFVGTIVGSEISAAAQRNIAQKQIDAIERQRQFVFDQLDPKKLAAAAKTQDIADAKARLELQKQIDPSLFAARKTAQEGIEKSLADLQGGNTQAVADQAAKEALAGTDVAARAKQQLIDAALQQLSLGASLPPDIQAELVKAGLEKGGMVTGAASPKGFGGQLTRQVLGSGAFALQQQRQQAASSLLGRAQELESQRSQLLGTLFPNLAALQLNKLKGQEGALAFSNDMMPSSGLSGKDIVNLWLNRVGATSSLDSQKTQAQYMGGMNTAAELQKGFAGATAYAANAFPTTYQLYQQSQNSGNWSGGTPGSGIKQNADGSWG